VRTVTYLVGIAYIGLCGLAVARSGAPRVAEAAPVPAAPSHPARNPPVAEAPTGNAVAWFMAIKPFCNAVEVETALRQNRPPSGYEGVAHEAACLALAGKVDRARTLIGGLTKDEQWRAAGLVFEIAHPVADAGDDRSAGPIMAMVVDFWPTHYMALYHAGISEFALGDHSNARTHLEAFLQHYSANDGWRSSAIATLAKLRQ
jgi:hypothetical protein